MARERRLFKEEFKREVVKLVNQLGATRAAIARDPGVGSNLLGRWCREVGGDEHGHRRHKRYRNLYLPRSLYSKPALKMGDYRRGAGHSLPGSSPATLSSSVSQSPIAFGLSKLKRRWVWCERR